MLSYTIELRRRGKGYNGKATVWQGPAVNIIDAIQIAKESVFPVLHTAKVIKIGELEDGEPEGDTR
jgi:hypothetical protein